jgi:hypothetical protein
MSNFVFNSYLYDVMTGTDKGMDYYRANMFDVWLCPSGVNVTSNKNKKDLRFSDTVFKYMFPDDKLVYIGNLGNMQVRTQEEDGMPSVSSYQEIFNIPASAYIFSKNDCPANMPIQNDFCYTAYDYSVDEVTRNHGSYLGTTAYSTDWKRREKYFQSEYGFSYNFDNGNTEYDIYEVPTTYLKGPETTVSASDVSLFGNLHGAVGGALLVSRYTGKRIRDISGSYVYKDPETWLQNSAEYIATSARPIDSTSGESIPCVYYELPKSYKISNAVVNIQWSENGLFLFS